MGGERVIRIFPTICVHMWRVRYVSCHSCNGNGGQCSMPFILFSLAEATYKRYPVVPQGEPLRKLRAPPTFWFLRSCCTSPSGRITLGLNRKRPGGMGSMCGIGHGTGPVRIEP